MAVLQTRHAMLYDHGTVMLRRRFRGKAHRPWFDNHVVQHGDIAWDFQVLQALLQHDDRAWGSGLAAVQHLIWARLMMMDF